MDEHCQPVFTNALRDWGTEDFDHTLKGEVESLTAAKLPLQHALTAGGLIDDSDLAVTVLHTYETSQLIVARVGVFFAELVGGCSCGDEPFSQPACCFLQVSIDKQAASVRFKVIDGSSQETVL